MSSRVLHPIKWIYKSVMDGYMKNDYEKKDVTLLSINTLMRRGIPHPTWWYSVFGDVDYWMAIIEWYTQLPHTFLTLLFNFSLPNCQDYKMCPDNRLRRHRGPLFQNQIYVILKKQIFWKFWLYLAAVSSIAETVHRQL